MLLMINENERMYFETVAKKKAEKSNAVELKQKIKFPKELLYLYSGNDNVPAELDRVTCIHMFESAPQ
jgi:hypothetical protein